MEAKTKKQTRYCCAECKLPVEVNARGGIVRQCAHGEAGVIASVSATAYGQGTARQKEAAQ